MIEPLRNFQLVLTRLHSGSNKAAGQEHISRAVLTMVSAGVALITALVFWRKVAGQSDVGPVVLTLAIDVVVTAGWFLIARGRWRGSAFLLPPIFLATGGYMVYVVGPVTTGILQLVLAVLLAGMLGGNSARWFMVVLSSLVYSLAGWQNGGLDLETFLESGTLLAVTLAGIALLEGFFTNQLNKSLVAVREREEKLESIFRAAPLGIGMVIERVIQEANPALCQMTGYARKDLIGNDTRLLYQSAEEYYSVGVEISRQISQRGLGILETRWRRADGAVRDIQLNCVLLDQQDPGRGYTFTAIDITARKHAQTALQTSKDLLRESQRLARIGHYDLDIASGVWESSEALNELFGIDESYCTDVQGWLQVIHPDDREAMAVYFTQNVLQEGEAFNREYRIVRVSDSEMRWVHGLGRLDFDADGKPVRMLGNIQDITERKQAAQALYESEERNRQMVENSPNPIFSINGEGNIQTWNLACEKTFHYDQSVIGQHYSILLRNEAYRAHVQGMLETLGNGQSISNLDLVYLDLDGGERFMVSRIYPFCNQRGEVQGYVFANTDITERKLAETKLRESAARYQAVVENQTEFVVRWKPDGTRSFVNDAYLRYFGLTMEEALSSSFLPLVLEEDRSAVEEKFSRLLSGECSIEIDVHRVIKPDGSVGWQEWTDQGIYNDRGELVEFQSIGRDVTERTCADEALRAKTEELEALFSISSHLRAAQSAEEMLPLVLDEMRYVLHSDANAVILLEPDNAHFTFALSDGPLKVNDRMQFRVNNSISGLVLQTRQPYLTENLSSDPHKTSELKRDGGLGPAIFVPVISDAEFLGVLMCARYKNGHLQRYSSSEARLLTAIGEMVGNALRRARLYDQALMRMQHLQTLHSIDTAISANLDLNVILEVLLTQGIPQLDVDAACVILLNPHTHILEYAAGKGFRSKQISATRLRLGDGLPGRVALERRVLYVADLSQVDPLLRTFLLREGFVSYQAVPLIAKGQLRGVLETFTRRPMDSSEERTAFLETLATQAAIAIDNSQLFGDLQRSNFELEMAYDATIEGWSRALELRDQETEGHAIRVTDMTVRLAQAIGVSGPELIHIRRGALLHDIGKMGVPDQILLKPGKLSHDEWEIMQQHTVYAFEMLWPIEFLRPAIDIPYCHHERWDGTGYPRQLKGEQIPLSARLFTIADVWDALTRDRPYRKAWSEAKALDYILRNKGKHFDPQVVDLFLQLRKNEQERGFNER